MKTPTKILAVSMLSLCVTGCMRSYDVPEYDDVDTAETAFLVPLEGATNDQAQFQSAEYLEKRKVATKRVQITHRWNQTGRFSNDGQWIANVRLIRVNRSPVTRLWTAEATTGTRGADQAIWVESKDSIGFSMGLNVTAYIPEEQAATFLYWYPTGSLEKVMDSEVRARCQQVAGDVAAQYDLQECREKKDVIIKAIRDDLIAFYAKRGITITTVGMYGGMCYENKNIQEAIDKTFINQQEKINAQAAFDSQQKKNDTLTLAADGVAEAARRQAKGQADAALLVAEAQAKANEVITKSLEEAKQNPAFLALKQLDVQTKLSEKWDGRMPQWIMGTGNATPNLMLQMPAPDPR